MNYQYDTELAARLLHRHSKKWKLKEDPLKLSYNNKTVANGFFYINAAVTLKKTTSYATIKFPGIYIFNTNEIAEKITLTWTLTFDPFFSCDINDYDINDWTKEKASSRLRKSDKIKIYNSKKFDDAIKIVLKLVFIVRLNEDRLHFGWHNYSFSDERNFRFCGITLPLKITKNLVLKETFLLPLSNYKEQLGSNVTLSDVESILNAFDPCVSYPIIFAVLYSFIPTEILCGDTAVLASLKSLNAFGKPFLGLNLCGNFPSPKSKKDILTPQWFANFFCNLSRQFEYRRAPLPQKDPIHMNSVRKELYNISLEDNPSVNDNKVHLLQDFPVIIQTKNNSITLSSQPYNRLVRRIIDNYLPGEAHFFPIFLTKHPMKQDSLLCIDLHDHAKKPANEKVNTNAIILRAFYYHFIDLLQHYADNMKDEVYAEGLQTRLDKRITDEYLNFLSPNENIIDENKRHNIYAFSAIFAVISIIVEDEILEKPKDAIDPDTAWQRIISNARNAIRPLLFHPYVEASANDDCIFNTFCLYVYDLFYSNTEEVSSLVITSDADFIFLRFPEAIKAFERKSGKADLKTHLCRELKRNGFLRKGIKGYATSKQIKKEKINTIGIRISKLQELCSHEK